MCLRGAAGNRESLGGAARGVWAQAARTMGTAIADRRPPGAAPPSGSSGQIPARRGDASRPAPALPSASVAAAPLAEVWQCRRLVLWLRPRLPETRRSLLPPSLPGPRSACPLPAARGHLSQSSALSFDRRRPPLHCPLCASRAHRSGLRTPFPGVCPDRCLTSLIFKNRILINRRNTEPFHPHPSSRQRIPSGGEGK